MNRPKKCQFGKMFPLIVLLLNSVGCDSGFCPNVCVCKWKSGKQSVECTDKALITIPDDVDGETQLLDVSGNNLQVLPKETFVRAALLNLQRIYLRNCRIGQIDEKALYGLSNVVELDLSNNLLTFVPSSIFRDVPNLRDLSLASNPIQKIENHAFHLIPGLVRLDLSHCQLRQISSKAFFGIDALESLKLNGNKLRDLKPKTIEVLNGLHGVELHDNPWFCDCGMRAVKIWLITKNIPHPVQPVCQGGPKRVINVAFKELKVDDFACKPEIRMKPETRFVEGVTGENATVTCKVESVPAARITWYWNGKQLTNNTSNNYHQRIIILESGEMDKKSSLVLMNARETDSSSFYCEAENRAGVAEANFTLRVSNRVSGTFAMFTNGQMAGLSIALIFLIFSIILLLVYLLLRIKKIPPRSVKQSSCRDENLTNGRLVQAGKQLPNSPVQSSSFDDKIVPTGAENQLYIRENNVVHQRFAEQPTRTMTDCDYGSLARLANKTYRSAAESSNPDLIVGTKRQRGLQSPPDLTPISGEYTRNETIYPRNLWSHHSELKDPYLLQSNSASAACDFNIDSNDRTPIIEEVADAEVLFSPETVERSYRPPRFRPEQESADMPPESSPITSPSSTNGGGGAYPNAKTIRVWQRGVQVLPPVSALKRALTRNSPDEGYQEGCGGTDV